MRWGSPRPGKWSQCCFLPPPSLISKWNSHRNNSQSEGKWVSYCWINRVRRLKVLEFSEMLIFVTNVVEWMQRSLFPCQTLWIVFVWCVFSSSSFVNYVCSSGESFSPMEKLAFTCLVLLPGYCPSWSREWRGSWTWEDGQGLLGWSGRNQTFSSDFLAYRKPTGSKIIWTILLE